MMNFQQRKRRSYVRQHMPAFLLSGLVLCMVLFSACSTGSTSGNTTGTNSATPSPVATVDPALKSQADTQLQTFQHWIDTMKQYNGNYAPYQSEYADDQQALSKAKTADDYTTVINKINAHIDSIKFPAMQAEATSLQQQLVQAANQFGQQHTYHDSFNNTDYPLGFEYGSNGVGGWAQDDLSKAKTMADYQQVIDDEQMYLTNFQAMSTDFNDKTPYNQVHKTDLDLLQHYQYMDKKVVVVSLAEQAMRLYDNGKLVNAFLVTTGRPSLPTPPGTWWVEGKQSPTVFKSSEPQSSPLWYPDTPINYAMQYHSGGYYIHDSWWRSDYGPGTNFPHEDVNGSSYASQGSHGCVNISKDNAAVVYAFVVLYTKIVIY